MKTTLLIILISCSFTLGAVSPLRIPGKMLPKSASSGISSPDDVSGLVGWFEADQSEFSGYSNGQEVNTWTDHSAISLNLTNEPSAIQCPYYTNSVLNGKPVVAFDFSDDFLYGQYPLAAETDFTVYLVVQFTAADFSPVISFGGGWGTFLTFSGSADGTAYVGTSTTTGRIVTSAGYIVTGEWGLHVAKKSGTGNPNMFLYRDGSLDSSSGTVPAPVDAAYVVGQGSAMPLGGQIAAILIYDEAHSDSDRALVEAYLNGKYAIY